MWLLSEWYIQGFCNCRCGRDMIFWSELQIAGAAVLGQHIHSVFCGWCTQCPTYNLLSPCSDHDWSALIWTVLCFQTCYLSLGLLFYLNVLVHGSSVMPGKLILALWTPLLLKSFICSLLTWNSSGSSEEPNTLLLYLGCNSLVFFFQLCDLCCVMLSSVTSTNKHGFTGGTEGLQPALPRSFCQPDLCSQPRLLPCDFPVFVHSEKLFPQSHY